MDQKKKRHLFKWLRISLFTSFFGLAVLLIRGDYTLRGYCDATFIPGITLLFFWFLKLMSDKGAFDVVGYGLGRMINGLRRKEERVNVQAHEFLEDKKESRRKSDIYYLPYIVISGLFLLGSVILLLLM